MTTRHHPIVNELNSNNENLLSRQAQAKMAKPTATTHRPALGELGNKVGGPILPLHKKTQSTAIGIAKPMPTKLIAIPKKTAAVHAPTNPTANRPRPLIKKTEKASVKPSSPPPQTSLIPVHRKISNPDTETNPNLLNEYVNEIYAYWRQMEDAYPIHAKFLSEHSTTPKMRLVLLNWLQQVHADFKCCVETLYLCISIIDRYLQSNKKIGSSTLQLVGTTAMMLACKYEEVYYADLDDYVFICDMAFTKGDVLRMERSILKELNFFLGKPTPIMFLRRYSKISSATLIQHHAAKYFLELTMLNYELAGVKPSLQAAAACCLAMSIFNENINVKPSEMWTDTLIYYSKYKFGDFDDVLMKMARVVYEMPTSSNLYKFIKDKYSDAKFKRVSVEKRINDYLKKLLN